MTRTRVLIAAALAATLTLPLASAGAAEPPRAAGHVATGATAYAGTPRAATGSTLAPAVPWAHRYARSIPASVRQVIVVRTGSWHSTRGVLSIYARTATGWREVLHAPARLGYAGISPPGRRHQDDGTTPAGLYAITSAFGRQANPGTTLPYTRVTADHWWVEDRRSAYYNQMRRASQGGFALRTTGYNSSEHLIAVGAQYDWAAVIDFNRPHPVVGRGAGIFLHANGRGATAGCVSVPHATMRTVMRLLSAAAHPRIAIGPATWLDRRG